MGFESSRKRFQPALCVPAIAAALSYFAPIAVDAAEPLHSVRGHSPTNVFDPPNLEEVSISADQAADGSIEGVAIFPGLYLAPEYINPSNYAPEYAGWTWVIDIDTLLVEGNVAWVGGVIVLDNRFDDEGNWWGFTVVDNGAGGDDVPDLLIPWIETDLDLLNDPDFASEFAVRGNFTVR